MECLDVLPVLLEQGDQEVHGESDVLHELLLGHVDVAHCYTEAQHLALQYYSVSQNVPMFQSNPAIN